MTGTGIRLVLCLDHFDTVLQTIPAEDEVFLRTLNKNFDVAYVIATEKTLDELKKDRMITSPLYRILISREMGLLPRNESILLVTCEFLFEWRTQVPDMGELLEAKRVEQQVMMRLGALPVVTELMFLYWQNLNEYEQDTLATIAGDQRIDLEHSLPAVHSLRQRALIRESLSDGTYRIFCGLFRDFVLRQRGSRRQISLEELTDSLAPRDRELFQYLQARPHQVCPFDELLSAVWGDANSSKRGLDAAIHRIREKLQDIYRRDWEYIQNVRGKGYQYVPKAD